VVTVITFYGTSIKRKNYVTKRLLDKHNPTHIAIFRPTANYKSNISASWLVRELTSPRLHWPRVGLSANCLVTYKTAYWIQKKTCHTKL